MNKSVVSDKATSLGYTLIELLITVTIVAILSAIAIPSFKHLIDESRLSSNTNNLIEALNTARSKAVSTHLMTVVAPVSAGDWSSGVQVFFDSNNNQIVEDGELIQNYAGSPSGSNITINATFPQGYARFQPDGRMAAGAGTITVCADVDCRNVVVALSGRIRVNTP